MIKTFNLPPIAGTGAATPIYVGGKTGIAVLIIAQSTNSSPIYVGDSGVTSANGIPVSPGQAVSQTALTDPRSGAELRLSDVYVIVAPGDTARIAYQERDV